MGRSENLSCGGTQKSERRRNGTSISNTKLIEKYSGENRSGTPRSGRANNTTLRGLH
jgi:hypothetical protein